MKKIISVWTKCLFISFCFIAFGQGVASAQSTNTNTCISPLSNDYLTKYEVIEEVSYVETNSAGPVLASTNAYVGAAIIVLVTNLVGSTSNAVVTFPGEAPALMVTNRSLNEFYVEVITNAYTNVTPQFPDGTYVFSIFNQDIPVTLPGDTALPNAPTLADYAADQNINPSASFTLRWNPFIAGGVFDFVSVTVTEVYDDATVFKTGAFGCPGALEGTAGSVVLPVGTLTSNQTYRADIDFIKVYTFDTNTYAGDALLAGTQAETRATIATGGGSGTVSAPVLSNAAFLGGGSVRFDVATTPGVTYTIQYNPNLDNSAGWTSLLTTDAVSSVVSFTNNPGTGTTAGFYRAISP